MSPNEFKALRQMLNFSQEQLAERWGLARNTITRYENGGLSIPKSKIKALNILKEEFDKIGDINPVYLEKDGVRIELIELVDHFAKNADAYYEHSEYLQLWIKNKVEDLLNERIESIKLIGKTAN